MLLRVIKFGFLSSKKMKVLTDVMSIYYKDDAARLFNTALQVLTSVLVRSPEGQILYI